MKTLHALLVSLSLLAAPSFAGAKEPPLTLEERTVVQVYDAPGFTKEQIQAGAKRWIAENFKSAKAVIEYEDDATGTIIGNGYTTINPPMKRGVSYYATHRGPVGFKMKVEAKDGKMRLTFTDVRLVRDAFVSRYYSTAGGEDPPTRRYDMDNIRVKLVEFGPQIVASLSKTDNW